MLDINREPHPIEALDAIIDVREEVVEALLS